MSPRHRFKHASLVFISAVAVHAATIPIHLRWLIWAPKWIQDGIIERSGLGSVAAAEARYTYDDVMAIQKNKWVMDNSTSWRALFTEKDFWGGQLAWSTSHKSYRPLTSLSYRLQVLGDGGGVDSVAVHQKLHAGNVLLFAVVSSLFYIFCESLVHEVGRMLQKTSQRMKDAHVKDSLEPHIPLLAGLLFAVHPVHTEAVACLVGRAEIMSGFFFLLSILAYMHYSPEYSVGTSLFFGTKYVWHVAAGMSAFASMLSKEQGITVLAVWVIIDLAAISLKLLRENPAASNAVKFHGLIFSVIPRMSHHIFTLCWLAAALGFRSWMNGHYAPIVFTDAENPAAHEPDNTRRWLSFFYINLLNGAILLFPTTLSVDWAMGSIPLISGWSDPRLFVPAFVVLIFFALTRNAGHIYSPRGNLSIIALAILLITFLPASNFFFYVGFVIAERVLFLPSMGFCLFLSLASEGVRRRPWQLFFWAVVLPAYAGRSVYRNMQWRTELALMEAEVRGNPRNARLHHGMGVALWSAQDEKAALKSFKKAWELHPGYHEAMNFIGVIHSKHPDRREEALTAYRKTLKLTPSFMKTLENLASLLVKSNNATELEEAREALMALSRCETQSNQQLSTVYTRIGSIEMRLGLFWQASRSLKRGIRLDTHGNHKARELLGILHGANGRVSMSRQLLRSALEMMPARVRNLGPFFSTENEHSFIQMAQSHICQSLAPHIRETMLQEGAQLLDSDAEVNMLLAHTRRELVTVFEDQSVESAVNEFCTDEGWSENDDMCHALLENLRNEESRMRQGGTRGAIVYNLDLDNTFTVPFSVDGKEVTLIIGGLDDVQVIVSSACAKHGLNSGDCATLIQHAEMQFHSQRSALTNRLWDWHFDRCQAWTFTMAQNLVEQLEVSRGSIATKSQFRNLAVLKNISAFPALALIYKSKYDAAPAADESEIMLTDWDRLKERLRFLRLHAIFAAYAVGQSGESVARDVWNINWGKTVVDLLHENAIRKKFQARQWEWSNPNDVWQFGIQEVKDRGLSAPKVILVSICQYDAQKTPLTMLSMHNKVSYASVHGYRLFIDTASQAGERHPAWGKIVAMLKYLNSSSVDEKTWVVWNDCDTLFMNFSLPLHALFTPSVLAKYQHGLPTAKVRPHLVVSDDGNMLNTGFFAVRKTPWVMRLLENVLDEEFGVFSEHTWWEQASMHWILENMPAEDVRGNVVVIPQVLVNSYPPEYSNRIHDHYSDGDFVVAFSGCATYIASKDCHKLFLKYSSLATVKNRNETARLQRLLPAWAGVE